MAEAEASASDASDSDPQLLSWMYSSVARHAGALKQQKAAWLSLHADRYGSGGSETWRQEWKRQDAFIRAFESSVFVSHVRTEVNFFKLDSEGGAVLPPAYPPERELPSFTRLGLFRLLISPLVRTRLLDALGLSLGAGAAGSLWAWLLLNGSSVDWITSVGDAASQVANNFIFFTTFLLFGCVSYVVSRWQDWLVNGHTLQGRLHDIGLLVSGGICNPHNPEVKRHTYRLYRLLNTAHALTYQSVHPSMPKSLDGFKDLGLLTAQEVLTLETTANKKRDAVLAWVSEELQLMLEEGSLRPHTSQALFDALRDLRALCARHHDLFARNQPNVWYALMYLIVDYQVGLAFIGYPFSLVQVDTFGDRTTWLRLAQPWTVVGVFLVASAYWGALAMVALLHNPFDLDHEAINTDALMGSSERCLFVQLRLPFLKAAAHKKAKKQRSVKWRELLGPATDATTTGEAGDAAPRGLAAPLTGVIALMNLIPGGGKAARYTQRLTQGHARSWSSESKSTFDEKDIY